MNYPEATRQVADQILQIFQAKADDRFYFHNLSHTLYLTATAKSLALAEHFNERNQFIVVVAAWLYDLEIRAAGGGMHEIRETRVTESILTKAVIPKADIDEIINCLLATASAAQPLDPNQKLLNDAVRFYMGTPQFPEQNKLLRMEIEALTKNKLKRSEWRGNTMTRLENQLFYTDYCNSHVLKMKDDNLQELIRTQQLKTFQRQLDNNTRHQKKTIQELIGSVQPDTGESIGTKKKNKYPKHHLSGVETVFRNSSSNNLSLSVMADYKAFIMISVNSILISVAIGLMIGKLVMVPKLLIPTMMLLCVNIVTIIYSVLATRPTLMLGKFTRQEVDNKTADLLFFGNFYKMPLEDFEFGMRQIMDDSEFLYSSLIKDIYYQGKVLGRKFRLLRYSYNIFMYGTAVTVLAYITSLFL